MRALRTIDAPVLTIATTRSEHVEDEGWLPEERLPLEPLDGAASTSLLTTLLEQGDVAAEPGVVDGLLARGRGNPLYLSEMTRVLVAATERGGIPDLDLLPVGQGVRALVGARLDALGAPARHVAQTVSVMGEVFWAGAAAQLVGEAARLDAALDELEAASILHRRPGSTVAGEAEWAFSHVVLRDVAYQRLPKSGRVVLHTRFADWLSELESGADLVEVVAFHLERSCLLARELSLRAATPPTERAVESLTAAADRAERRRGLRESLGFSGRALALAPADDARLAASLRLRRARNLVWLGELDEADEQLRSLALEAVVGGWTELDCESQALLGNVAMKQERFVDAGAAIERAQLLAEGLGEHPLRVRVAFEAAALDDYEGRFDEAIDTLESAIAVAAALDEPDMLSEGHLRLGTVLFNSGRLAEADVALSRCTATPGRQRPPRRAGLVRPGRGAPSPRTLRGVRAAGPARRGLAAAHPDQHHAGPEPVPAGPARPPPGRGRAGRGGAAHGPRAGRARRRLLAAGGGPAAARGAAGARPPAGRGPARCSATSLTRRARRAATRRWPETWPAARSCSASAGGRLPRPCTSARSVSSSGCACRATSRLPGWATPASCGPSRALASSPDPGEPGAGRARRHARARPRRRDRRRGRAAAPERR